MTPEIILIALITAPILVLILLSVNASLVFLSLCLGDVLMQFTSDDAASIVSGAGSSVHVTANIIKLAVLLAPAVVTAVVMIKSVRKRAKRILNALPAVGTGALLALLVVPLLSPSLSSSIITTQLWSEIAQFQSAIVAASALVCLLFLWTQRPKASAEDKHAKGKGKE